MTPPHPHLPLPACRALVPDVSRAGARCVGTFGTARTPLAELGVSAK
jgi:hypothetical protein